MRLRLLAVFSFAIVSSLSAFAETRTTPPNPNVRTPATNYSTNPNAANPKLGGPTAEQYVKACAQIRSDCVASCKPKPGKAAQTGKTICDQPCEGWFKPLCEQQKANAGCFTNALTQGAASSIGAIFAKANANACASTCVYQTDKGCAELDEELIRIKNEAKKVKLIP